jgi:multidrug efflux system membrane fusion protein
VTTGFANLSDGAKVVIGKDDQAPAADLAPRKKRSSRDAPAKDGQAKDGQGKDGQGKDGEHRGKRGQSEGDQKGPTAPAAASEPPGGAAKSQP